MTAEFLQIISITVWGAVSVGFAFDVRSGIARLMWSISAWVSGIVLGATLVGLGP